MELTKAHNDIIQVIKNTLKPYDITALRADDKDYDTQLYSNILTYLHGCKFGIAVFERLEGEEHNPNVAFEVGYLMAIDKPVCILKDKTVKALQSDLIGHLYRQFDPQDVSKTLPRVLKKWLQDKGFIKALPSSPPRSALTHPQPIVVRTALPDENTGRGNDTEESST